MDQQPRTARRGERWLRVTRASPCPICEKPDWCMVSPDGSMVACMRIESGRYKQTDTGRMNFHPAGSGGGGYEKPPCRPPPEQRDFAALSGMAVSRLENLWKRAALSESLGVSCESLKRLRQGLWMRYGNQACASWPMRTPDAKVIGIQLRLPDGEKRSVYGSKLGWFIPKEIEEAAAERLFMCEGPTDCAALLDLGYAAVGRPSAWYNREITRLVDSFGPRRITFMVDRDLKPGCGRLICACRECWPGLSSSLGLAALLNTKGTSRTIDFCLPPAGTKDIRQLKRDYGDAKAQEVTEGTFSGEQVQRIASRGANR